MILKDNIRDLYVHGQGGYFVWITMPENASAAAVAKQCRIQNWREGGVAVSI